MMGIDRVIRAFRSGDAELKPADDGAAVVACVRTASKVVCEPAAVAAGRPETAHRGVPQVELLFIERAARTGDPWSGQIAFPGGRREAHDADEMETALRETREEVGLCLPHESVIGRLDDQLSPRQSGRRLRISAFVAVVVGQPALVLEHEVADAFWVPLEQLLDAHRRIDYEYSGRPGAAFPAIDLDGKRVLWGLTLRIFENFVARLDLE